MWNFQCRCCYVYWGYLLASARAQNIEDLPTPPPLKTSLILIERVR